MVEATEDHLNSFELVGLASNVSFPFLSPRLTRAKKWVFCCLALVSFTKHYYSKCLLILIYGHKLE